MNFSEGIFGKVGPVIGVRVWTPSQTIDNGRCLLHYACSHSELLRA